MPEPIALSRITSHLEDFDGAFLQCTDCQAVHRIMQADRALLYTKDGAEVQVDDMRRFLGAHRDHRFQVLRRSSDAETLSHARWDPMCRVVWEVSDGETDYVVSFGRTEVESPREYTIVPGRMRVVKETIEIDGDVLARVIDEALFPFVAPESKVAGVVQRCRDLVAGCAADELDPIDELREDPNVQLACLPARVAGELRRDLEQTFADSRTRDGFDAIADDLQVQIPIVRLARRYRIDRFV